MAKKLPKLLFFIFAIVATSCYKADDDFSFNPNSGGGNNGGSVPCGSYNGRKTYTGPKGGCYYINSNGNKVYVDKKYCC